MANILCLETATTNCSVSLSSNGNLLILKEQNEHSYTHSEQLHVFIKEAVQEASLELSDLDAIAVSKGPGSYTGLRIGVSAAKGLCYSLDIPLISIPTLESLSHQVKAKSKEVIIALLDARRMEVYSAIFDEYHQQIVATKAEIIDENSFDEFNTYSKVHMIGNGAEKCKGIIELSNVKYYDNYFPSAREMTKIAFNKYEAGDFEDLAYFEPFYLKDFILGGTKKA